MSSGIPVVFDSATGYFVEIAEGLGVMIVILTYFSDGSGKPEIEFVEAGPDQAERVARTLVGAVEAGKQAEVFKIESVGGAAVRIGEADA